MFDPANKFSIWTRAWFRIVVDFNTFESPDIHLSVCELQLLNEILARYLYPMVLGYNYVSNHVSSSNNSLASHLALPQPQHYVTAKIFDILK